MADYTTGATTVSSYLDQPRRRRMADGTYVDDYGNTLMAPDYQSEFTTPGDIKRAQQAATAEYAVNAGIGALGSAAQLGTSFIDTAQDTKNKQELARLEKLEKGGKLGLTGEERATYERGLLNPVKAIAADADRLAEARMAAGGSGHDAASTVRAQRESQRRLDEAGIAAAQKIEAAHIARKAEQREEMEQRRSYESGRETQRLNYVAQAVPGLLANIGKAAAGVALPARMTDAQIVQMQRATDANGAALYPGIQGMSPDAARVVIEKSASPWANAEARSTLQSGTVYATHEGSH